MERLLLMNQKVTQNIFNQQTVIFIRLNYHGEVVMNLFKFKINKLVIISNFLIWQLKVRIFSKVQVWYIVLESMSMFLMSNRLKKRNVLLIFKLKKLNVI